ncbi:MAG TPA: quinone-dependent dihydroorotate dehydrogenase [Thermoanaerobaculia bacterium]|nr:quinone-dependent dihydroorotate dehydrogenase [Thermoanaerobaculia bacterium]
MLYRALRPLLFRMDAEGAHQLVARQMEALQEIPLALRLIAAWCRPPAAARRHLLGLTFPSPVGIAAGFDKDARMIPMLAALGFGFVEVGTVTPRPQAGNPPPRLFRDPPHRALINRLGFNNEGAGAVAERLLRWRASGAALFSPPPPLFVNIGKNRDTPLEDAAADYAECYRRLAPHADAVVLNLSSPNTPGLRDLQRPEQLEKLMGSLEKRGPLLVKIDPDLDDSQIAEVCKVCVRLADGMVCTNTTLDRPPGLAESGGLSGAPLMRKSTEVLRKVRQRVGPGYPLVGVGGIFTPEDVREKLAAGADLVQVYTGFVYEGPALPRRLSRAVTP